MKKFILISILALSFVGLQAQFAKSMTFGNGLTTDSLTNSEVGYAYTPYINAPNSTLQIQVTATQISGTTAGSIWLQESIDGTTYKTVNQTNHTALKATTNDTLTNVNGATQIWELPNAPSKKYRLYINQTGTSSSKYAAVYSLTSNVKIVPDK